MLPLINRHTEKIFFGFSVAKLPYNHRSPKDKICERSERAVSLGAKKRVNRFVVHSRKFFTSLLSPCAVW